MPTMHRSVLSLSTALLPLLLSSASPARTLVVSPSGNDSASGTVSAPYAHIARAAALSLPGDTVQLRQGNYRLEAQINPVSGTASAPIVYRSWPGEKAVIDGNTGYCMSLTAKAYLTFKELAFTTRDTAVGAGMVYFEGTRHIEFLGCEFYGMPAPHGWENSAVIRCMSTGWPDTADVENSDSCVFRDNHFHDNASPALRLYDTEGWIIENNLFTNCDQAIGAKDEPYDLLVRHNRIEGGDMAFYFAMQGGGRGVRITENLVIGSNTGFMIGGLGTEGRKRADVDLFNNTFVDVLNFVHGWPENDYDSGISIRDNIVHCTRAANISAGDDIGARFLSLNKYGSLATIPQSYRIDFNNYSMPGNDLSLGFIDGGKSFATLSDWQNGRSPFDVHSLATDPHFVDPAASDFHLQAGSPCQASGSLGQDRGAYPRGNDGTVIGPRLATAVDIRQTRRTRPLRRDQDPFHSPYRIDGRLKRGQPSAPGHLVP